ncbi:hypothetical protein K2Y11_23920 [bacterium]|nr:hypothetical protein [bacterium]
MSFKRAIGAAVVVVGIGCLGHWVDRSFFHPTSADRAFFYRIADEGGPIATQGRGPASIFLLLAIGAIGYGQKLINE